MRIGDDANLVTSFDTVGGWGSGNSWAKKASVNDYLLKGSADGITWDELCSTNKTITQAISGYQWFFTGEKYENGDAANHMGGCPIRSRPLEIPQMLNNCWVSVSNGAKLKIQDGDHVEISRLRVDFASTGTIENAALAENGHIDITGVVPGTNAMELPLSFEGMEDGAVARIVGWELTIAGDPPGKYKLAASGGRLMLIKKGTVVLFR